MSGCKRDDQFVIINNQGGCHRNQPTIRFTCKLGNGALNVFAILPTEWAHLHLNNRATDWAALNWPILEVDVGSRTTPTRVTLGAISLSSPSHFAPIS